MSEILSRDAILARRRDAGGTGAGPAFTTERVELDQGAVIVRGLSRGEQRAVGRLGDDVDGAEELGLSYALVEPAMTLEDVHEWCQDPDAAADIAAVVAVVHRLSGMAPGQGKDATKSVPRGRSRAR